MKIRIGLPNDRDFAGWLAVLDADGAVVFGPVPAAGRSHDELALAHGNASRNPLRPYGDTPLGTYAVRGIVEPTDSKTLPAAGVVLLEPATDQAALADAHGRFRFFIQGGGGDDELHATAGGIRLRDQDHVQLVALMRRERGRVRCEIVTTDRRGPMISLARSSTDRDPPALPGRPYVSTHPSAVPWNAIGARDRGAGFAPRMFLAAETSGAGGGGATPYGGAGGIDLNLPDDLAITKSSDDLSGFSALTLPSGFTPLVNIQFGSIELSLGTQTTDTQTTDPYTNAPGTGPSTPYTGNPVNSYLGTPQQSVGTDQYTGAPSTDPYTNDTVPAAASTAVQQRDTLDNEDAKIQDMVQMVQQYNQQQAAAQATQSQQQSANAQATPPATTPGQDSWSTNAQPNIGISQPNPQPSPTTSSSSSASMYPWGLTAVVGAASSQANLPSGQPTPSRLESTGAWDRANPSQAAEAAIDENVAMGFLHPLGPNVSTAVVNPGKVAGDGTEEGRIDEIEMGTINRLIRGQTAEISAFDARLARGEIPILAPSGVTRPGLDYLTASRLPSGEYVLNVGDTASRYTTRDFKTSQGPPKAQWQAEVDARFGPGGKNFSHPDPDIEQGIRDAYIAGRWRSSPVQIDTVDFSPQGQGRMTINTSQVKYSDAGSTPSARALGYFGYYNLVGGTISSVSQVGDDVREGNWFGAALNATGGAGGMLAISGLALNALEIESYAASAARLLTWGKFLGAPAAVISSAMIGVRIGTNLYQNYVNKELVFDAGSWVEEKSTEFQEFFGIDNDLAPRVLGATVAAGVAVVDAADHAPEAARDYARETWTLDPDEIDWGRTVSPWRWF